MYCSSASSAVFTTIINRELVSTVLKVCLLLGIRCQQVFQSNSWFKRVPKFHRGIPMATLFHWKQKFQWQPSSIGNKSSNGNKCSNGNKVPVAAKVPMATKVSIATCNKCSNGNKSFNSNKSSNGNQKILAVLASYVIWACYFFNVWIVGNFI